MITFNFAALAYLNFWLEADCRIYTALQTGSVTDKLAALQEGASRFRISRNLHTKHDVDKGRERFGPVLEIIDSLSAKNFSGDLAKSVLSIRDAISAKYGNRDVLSATTKFLWLKVQAPIVIYDSQARIAIGTPSGDLIAFYEGWFAKYSDHENEIDEACCRLSAVRSYTVNPTLATKSYIDSIAQCLWFKQRVFDIYLWHLGKE